MTVCPDNVNPLFDCPAAWPAFMDREIVVSTSGGSVALKASVILAAGDSAAQAYSCDVYGIVFMSKEWPLPQGPARGTMIALDDGTRLYVSEASRKDSCWHVRAMTRLTPTR